MDSAPSVIEFVASLPSIKSAILLDGCGDGGQVKLEVDRTQVGALLLLQQWYAGQAFEVRVTSLDKQMGTNGKPELEARTKRKSEWQAA